MPSICFLNSLSLFLGFSGTPQISSVLNVCCVLTLRTGLPGGIAESGDVQVTLLKLDEVKMQRMCMEMAYSITQTLIKACIPHCK